MESSTKAGQIVEVARLSLAAFIGLNGVAYVSQHPTDLFGTLWIAIASVCSGLYLVRR